MRSSDPSFTDSSRPRSLDFGDGSPVAARRSSCSSSDTSSASSSPSGGNNNQFARLLSLQLQRQVLLEQQGRANSALLRTRSNASSEAGAGIYEGACLESACSTAHENRLRRQHSSYDIMLSSPTTAVSASRPMPLRLMRTSSLRVATATDPRERLEILEREIAAQRQLREEAVSLLSL